ncbi:hypothetical protein [Portibacter lacus]|nr:hypothetical protein [Portibacter lacus]
MENIRNYPDGMEIEEVEERDGKYLMKFPFLEVPVEVGQNFYKTFFEN